jgi:hypothetical protein
MVRVVRHIAEGPRSQASHERESLTSLTRVNPFFSNEKPGRRSYGTSGDFGKLISESLPR